MRSGEIIKLFERYYLIGLCKKKIQNITTELANEKKRSLSLSNKVDKEYQDIVFLEEKPLSRLFNDIVKKRKDALDNEKEEYLFAVLEYKESKKMITLLEYELSLLKNYESDENAVLDLLNQEISKTVHSDSLDLADRKTFDDLYSTLKRTSQLKVEFSELLEVAEKVKFNFEQVCDYLKLAQDFENWGHSYQEIQQGKLERKSNIDKAQSHIYIIKQLLIHLNSELEDVIIIDEENNKLYGFNFTYYHNLIKDWLADNKLLDTVSATANGLFVISKFVIGIKFRMDLNEKKLNKASDRLDIFIEDYLIRNN